MAHRPHIPERVKQRVRDAARDRCAYCLAPQRMVMAHLEVEHVIPRSKGGSDDESNLSLACPFCNEYKGSQIEAVDPDTGETVQLFNPRKLHWLEHFAWEDGFTVVVGISPVGRATVIALRINNNSRAISARRNFVKAGWNPLSELEADPPQVDL
jgi:hypothetical protein